MAPRQSLQPNFFKCNHCSIIICKEYSEKHRQKCQSASRIDLCEDTDITAYIKCLSETFQHPFIYDGVLYGVVDDNNFSEQFKCLPKSAILMHPAVMKICGITVRSAVKVRGHGAESLHFAWPYTVNKKMNICIQNQRKSSFKAGELVSVSRYTKDLCGADRIQLHVLCPDDISSDSEFKEFIFRQLYDSYIKCGSSLKCNYHRSKCTLTVLSIHGEKKNESVNSSVYIPSGMTSCEETSNDFSELVTQFSDLNLTETSRSEPQSCHNLTDKSYSEDESVCYKTANESGMASLNSSVSKLDDTVSFSGTFNMSLLSKTTSDLCTENAEYYYVNSSTVLDIVCNEKSTENVPQITFNSINGLQEQIERIKAYLGCFLNEGAYLFHGLLFIGSSGVGKSMIATAISNEYSLPMLTAQASDIYLKYIMHGKNELAAYFREAYKKQPSIIFLDEVDILCTMFANNKGGVISALVGLLDKLQVTKAKVLVLASACDSNKIDASLKYPGRLDIEIKFDMPDKESRNKTLKAVLDEKNHKVSSEEFSSLAEAAHGFSHFNMHQLCMEAEFQKLRYHKSDLRTSETDDSSKLSYEDLASQLKLMKPGIARNDQISVHKVHWKDIGGMYEVKEKLRQVVEMPLKHPAIFQRFGISASHGILLYGPPGCSKTMIAKALATESSLNFIPVKGPELFSKWVGESEKAVRDLFRRAKEAAPCIVFFDEIDALVGDRGSCDGSEAGKRVVTQLLTEVDGTEQLEGVIIIAATNRPDILDPAMLRPGRLDHLIYVPLPDARTRKEIFDLKFKTMPISDNVDVTWLVKKTDGYSGAEITAVCHEAALLAISENWPDVVQKPVVRSDHLAKALDLILPRIPKEAIQFYEMFSSSISLPDKSI